MAAKKYKISAAAEVEDKHRFNFGFLASSAVGWKTSEDLISAVWPYGLHSAAHGCGLDEKSSK